MCKKTNFFAVSNLDKDILTIKSKDILKTKVLYSIVDGKICYQPPLALQVGGLKGRLRSTIVFFVGNKVKIRRKVKHIGPSQPYYPTSDPKKEVSEITQYWHLGKYVNFIQVWYKILPIIRVGRYIIMEPFTAEVPKFPKETVNNSCEGD
jgi:hypothetical protein